MSSPQENESARFELSPQATLWWMLGMIAVYLIGMSTLFLSQHESLNSNCFDLGIFDQGVWLVSHGVDPFLTTRGLQLQADHFQPIVYLLAPIYWLREGPTTLIMLQTLVLALGAIPVYHLARRTARNRHMGVLFAVIYLTQPVLHYMNRSDFHFNTLAVTFLLYALWYLESGQVLRYWIAILLTLLTSETAGFTIIFLGLEAWRIGGRAQGVMTVLAGVMGLVGAAAFVKYHSEGLSSLYLLLYAQYGHTPLSIVSWLASHPFQVLADLGTPDNLTYTIDLLTPVMLLPLLAPNRMLPAVPVLLGNLLSWREAQHGINHQYNAMVLPFVMWAAILGYQRCRGILRRGIGPHRIPLILFLALVLCFVDMVLFVRGTIKEIKKCAYPSSAGASKRVSRALPTWLPPEASVSTESDLGAHLGGRPEMYLFPNPFQEVAWGGRHQSLIDQSRQAVDPISPGAFRRALACSHVDYILLRHTADYFPIGHPDRDYFFNCLLTSREYGIVLQRDGLIALKKNAPHQTRVLVYPRLLLLPWIEWEHTDVVLPTTADFKEF